jgi:hypothetical protein
MERSSSTSRSSRSLATSPGEYALGALADSAAWRMASTASISPASATLISIRISTFAIEDEAPTQNARSGAGSLAHGRLWLCHLVGATEPVTLGRVEIKGNCPVRLIHIATVEGRTAGATNKRRPAGIL